MRLSLSILAPLLACSIYTQSLPAPIPTRQGTIIKKMCRTDNPSSEFRKAHENLQTQGSQLKARKANSSGQLLVDTYIHFVTTQDQALIYGVPGVLDRLISSQAKVLDKSYAPSNIAFNVLPYTYHVNNTWATNADDTAMKIALREGSYSALNIYFQTNLSSIVDSPRAQSSQLLGFCTLPQSLKPSPSPYSIGNKTSSSWCASLPYPSSRYELDGCNVLASSMPGAGLQGYEEGKTAVHEIGHWFGLLHTFQGNSCSRSNKGDYVGDTAQESESTNGCPPKDVPPSVKNSCPGRPGTDPVTNYMDYSSDACYEGFSNGQVSRMHNMFTLFRKGK